MQIMKKYFLLFGLVVLGFISTNAQVEFKGLIGTNFANFSNLKQSENVSGRAGYQFGGGVLIGDKFYVEPGIQFGRSSRTITVADGEISGDIDFDQNFVKIPVYAGYHILGHESDVFALRLFAGPAVLIPGKIKKGSDQISKDNIANAVWAADVGVGLDILFLFIEFNYEHSFTDHFTDGTSDAKHNAFVINAGIHLDF
jgi:hypothetical protein